MTFPKRPKYEDWKPSAGPEQDYARALIKIAKETERYLTTAKELGLDTTAMQLAARRYADLIEPYAISLSSRMGEKLVRQDKRMWMKNSADMGKEMRALMEGADIGPTVRMWMKDQVALIKSIPEEAAQRVHDAALGHLVTGKRAEAIQHALQTTLGVTESRARLIARTETARAQSMLTMTRAEQAGSEGYQWRTAKDRDVRQSHKEMEGVYCRWDTLPLLSDGTRTMPGGIYNCRCYCQVIF